MLRESTPKSVSTDSGKDDALIDALDCRRCGYSLRGLRGDAIRCPECAEITPRYFGLIDHGRAGERCLMLSLAITWSAIFGLPVIWCLAAAILNSSPLEFAGAFLSLIVWVPGLILFGEGSNFKKRWLADFLIASALGELTTIAVIAGVLSFCGYAYLMVGGLGATLLSGIGVFAVCMRLMRARALRAEIEVAHSTWAARQTTDTSSTETPAPPSPRPPE